MINMTDKDVIRFWSKIDVPEDYENDCWLWNASVNSDGYGNFSIWDSELNKNKQFRSSRFMFHLYGGKIPIQGWNKYNFEEIPNNLLVCHTCDKPRCVNPKHLFLGTVKDNAIDCKNKGRLNTIHGETHFGCKFDNKTIIMILEGIKSGEFTNFHDITEDYGVSHIQMYDILRGKARIDVTKDYDLPSLMSCVLTEITEYEAKQIKTDVLKNKMRVKDAMLKYNRSRYQISMIKNCHTFVNVSV